MRSVLAAAVLTAAALSACSSPPSEQDQAISACQGHIINEMRDAQSAEFRNVTVAEYDPKLAIAVDTAKGVAPGRYWKVTGEVNGANESGGKTGFTDFECSAVVREGSPIEARWAEMSDELKPSLPSS